jgi:hypothetical protein
VNVTRFLRDRAAPGSWRRRVTRLMRRRHDVVEAPPPRSLAARSVAPTGVD